jgi:microcystin-dependent protein
MEEYLGMVKLFAGTFVPNGWAECNGQLLNIHSSEALYSIILNTYGGDGMTTFALPDLRGRIPVGLGTQGGTTYEQGKAGGAESTKLSVKQMPSHVHTAKLNLNASDGISANPEVDTVIGKPNYIDGRATVNTNLYNKVKADIVNTTMVTVDPAGADDPAAIDIRQPFIGMRYIICCQGLYPPRS